jgi:hypothetical protein
VEFLSRHIKETIDIADGWITGQLFVENGNVGIQRSTGTEIILDSSYLIEIRNGDEYQRISIEQALTLKTEEGWPLFGGLYTRVKRKEG